MVDSEDPRFPVVREVTVTAGRKFWRGLASTGVTHETSVSFTLTPNASGCAWTSQEALQVAAEARLRLERYLQADAEAHGDFISDADGDAIKSLTLIAEKCAEGARVSQITHSGEEAGGHGTVQN